CVAVDSSLLAVLYPEHGCRFSESARLANTDEPRGPDLLEPSREDRYGFLEIARASAFANARSVDVFVDVPDRTAQGEAGRFNLRHDSLLSDGAKWRPLRVT